ncbi:3-oxoacyl-[acyl-carrier-protein] synthase III C-terminal domain-containing protein [Saccharothrix variisporea]|uniref:3-oxoacyl-[acyl-carrier-protein] synthase-3 n=1 Tax=Saccharothrix variisporea TaxID=543527 RepID=A0A495XQG2_9PSEU|nr:3-oxoacyl-[acyl-carrier-protein] synthase III C-terminal domain-containing protein [Saccharothrix variisporea]RKT74683.1 3-oxoacyl-[acyl-carrier-protein] synthase-3 [Saccharothrix variisporea]
MVAAGLAIEAMTAFVPEPVSSIEAVAPRLRLGRAKVKLFRKVHGLDRLHLDPDLSVLDLVTTPAARLVADLADPDRITHVVYAHTIQDVAPAGFDIATALAARLGLHRANAFALTQQNCASGLAAVDVCGELLAAADDPDALALVVTGEKAFSPMAQLIENTTIMGDASAACLVGRSGAGERVLSYHSRTDGRYADGIRLDARLNGQFGLEYAARLAETIRAALAQAGLTLADVELVVPHNVNVSSWRKVVELLGTDPATVFLDNVAEYGHCYCSDPFLNYTQLRDRGRLTAGGHYVCTALGLGATYAAMVLRHEG